MLRLKLDETDVQVLVNSFFYVDDLDRVILRDWPDMRDTLANIVGDLRSQYKPAAGAPRPERSRRRVDLAALLVDKYVLWNRMLMKGEVRVSADDVVQAALPEGSAISGSLPGAGDADSAIALFEKALDSPRAWDRYELRLCWRSDEELRRLTFADMVEAIVGTAVESSSHRNS